MWDLHVVQTVQCLDHLRFYSFTFRLDLTTGSRDAEDKGRTEAHYSDNHTQQVWKGLHPLEGQQHHDVRGCACGVAEQFVHLKACEERSCSWNTGVQQLCSPGAGARGEQSLSNIIVSRPHCYSAPHEPRPTRRTGA